MHMFLYELYCIWFYTLGVIGEQRIFMLPYDKCSKQGC